MIYLSHFLNFCNAAKVRVEKDIYIDGDHEFSSFKEFFDWIAQVYEIGGTINYIDYEFQYLTDLIWTVSGIEKTKGLDDLEFLSALVRRVFVELKDGAAGLEYVMSKLYWHFLQDDKEAVWQTLVSYYYKAVGIYE
ncbi:hypothetical protein [Stutzerimonas nitrititolerans]|uniref:hypothetical protein n=1 Tax=Stutzerimonas nitrititolerans TaxID=2482751 RepID=UPI002898E4B3|nr:hypothetical protein [Stutzerimonas nitrititolerans]